MSAARGRDTQDADGPQRARPAGVRWELSVGLYRSSLRVRLMCYTVMAVLSATTTGYDWIGTYASDLSIGPTGWIMQCGFVACGVLEIVFAVGLLRAGGVAAGPVLIGVAGVGFAGAGVFVTD